MAMCSLPSLSINQSDKSFRNMSQWHGRYEGPWRLHPLIPSLRQRHGKCIYIQPFIFKSTQSALKLKYQICFHVVNYDYDYDDYLFIY